MLLVTTVALTLVNAEVFPICIGVLTFKDQIALNRTLHSYVEKELFASVQESIIFFQEVDTSEKRQYAQQVLLDYPYFHKSILEPTNTYFDSFLKIAEACTAKYVAVLEEDYMIFVNASQVQIQLNLAIDLLEGQTASLIRIRNRHNLGRLHHAHHALIKYGDLPRNLMFEHVAWNETAELYLDFLSICRENPKTYCTPAEYASYVNSPTLIAREDLIRWSSNLLPKQRHHLHRFEPRMTDEMHKANITVAWSDGIFTHVSEKFKAHNDEFQKGQWECKECW